MAQTQTAAQPQRLKSLKSSRPLEHGGPVAEAVRRALVEHAKDDATYEDIAREVREEVEGAQTTARSVASIVRGLRRDGYRVPTRRSTRH